VIGKLSFCANQHAPTPC